ADATARARMAACAEWGGGAVHRGCLRGADSVDLGRAAGGGCALRAVPPDVSSVGVSLVLPVRSASDLLARAAANTRCGPVRLRWRAWPGLEDGVLRARPGNLSGGARGRTRLRP